MQKIKYSFYLLIFFGSLFILFGPETVPDNFQIPEILDKIQDSQVIIIFNSGGWGDTPLGQANDFRPIIEGIQRTLNEWGYKSFVLPYNRTKTTFLGRVHGSREFSDLFKKTSEDLAGRIEAISRAFPDKKIIVAGLSSGGTFALKTYKKVSEDVKSSVYAITAGMPFWAGDAGSDPHFLSLDNGGKDMLTKGNAGFLMAAFLEAPFKWLGAKISGRELSFSQSFQVSGHAYPWTSSQINQTIVAFLNKEIH